MTGTIAERVEHPKGLLARTVGIIFSPGATYADVAARPRVLGALAVVLTVAVLGSAVFFSTDVGREALLDQQLRTLDAFGRRVSDEQYEVLQRTSRMAAYFTPVTQLVFIPLVTLVVSGAMLAVFNVMLGGDATFRQALAIVAHSQILTALQQLFVLPLDYAKGSLSSPTSLAVFLPFLDDASFPARFLGSIDLFWIWLIVNLSIGIGVLYRRRGAPIAVALLASYAALAVVIAVVRAMFSGA